MGVLRAEDRGTVRGVLPRSAAALLAAALAGACGPATDAASAPVAAAAPAIAVSVEFDASLAAAPPRTITDADLLATDRVYVSTRWTGPTAGRAQRLDLLSPNGAVYYSTTVPLDGPAPAGVVLETEPDGSRRVVVTLEVAGTPIDMFWMTGAWRATASLEQGDVTASATLLLR